MFPDWLAEYWRQRLGGIGFDRLGNPAPVSLVPLAAAAQNAPNNAGNYNRVSWEVHPFQFVGPPDTFARAYPNGYYDTVIVSLNPGAANVVMQVYFDPPGTEGISSKDFEGSPFAQLTHNGEAKTQVFQTPLTNAGIGIDVGNNAGLATITFATTRS